MAAAVAALAADLHVDHPAVGHLACLEDQLEVAAVAFVAVLPAMPAASALRWACCVPACDTQ